MRRHAVVIIAALLALAAGVGLGALLGARHQHAGEGASAAAAQYTCAMHPQIRSDKPGLCPICGMELIPVSEASAAAAGPVSVHLSERARALAKVRTTEVSSADTATPVVLVGRVDYDETRLRYVTAWAAGRIERLHVAVTGARVGAGQAVATLYSPEIFSAQSDLLLAKRDNPRGPTYAAARKRLQLLGVPDAVIDDLERGGEPKLRVEVRAPFAGTVVERMVSEGSYVEAGTPLYRIADLSRVWVQLDAYERDLRRLRVGAPVRLTGSSLPEAVEGKVAFVDPVIDPERRTARVRVEVPNPKGALKPGMYVDAALTAEAATGLTVPATAPLFTGKRTIVYVEGQDGTYAPRVVNLGPRSGDVYPVLEGLVEGERVVTSGAFALDADLQIKSGTSEPQAQSAPPKAKLQLEGELAPALRAYLGLQEALAKDDLAASKSAAQALATAAAGRFAEIAETLGAAGSLEAARGPFEELSEAFITRLTETENPLDATLQVVRCPMVGSRGARWVQRQGGVSNAYFGAAMLTCGAVESVAEPGAKLTPVQP